MKMQESKSCALPLGERAIYLYVYNSVFFNNDSCRKLTISNKINNLSFTHYTDGFYFKIDPVFVFDVKSDSTLTLYNSDWTHTYFSRKIVQ